METVKKKEVKSGEKQPRRLWAKIIARLGDILQRPRNWQLRNAGARAARSPLEQLCRRHKGGANGR